jgi:hypothetical protein
MAEIGFIEVGADETLEATSDRFDVPLTAERIEDGRKRQAFAAAGYDFATRYKFRDRGDGRLLWEGWLIPADVANDAASILRQNGNGLLALQIERAVEEAVA